MSHVLFFTIRVFCWSVLAIVVGVVLTGCSSAPTSWDETSSEDFPSTQKGTAISIDEGGTVPIIEMPFASGHVSQCTQGVDGSTSHHSSSTMYDIDFDTSNTAKEELRAPVSGTAYVHMEDAKKNFGYHVCIFIGNGMYVIVAHMADIAVTNGQQVVAGQYIGHEGCTGYCSGDHVHIGLHVGDAQKMGQFGTSVPVRYLLSDKTAKTSVAAIDSSALVCGIKSLGDKVNGHFYVSALPVAEPTPESSSDTRDAVSSNAGQAPSSTDASDGKQGAAPTFSPDVSTVPKQNPPPTTSNDDVWVNDYNLNGLQETLMMKASRWSNANLVDQDAFVWGKGGCFDNNLTESDRIHAKYGYYLIDFSQFQTSCIAEFTLISAIGTDGNSPNNAMSNWNWWQNASMCSAGSNVCELQKNGQSWEEWMIRVSWDPTSGLVASGNGFTKNSQLK